MNFTIVGGGVMGLTLAWELTQLDPHFEIEIIEKESDVAKHASGRNSGILHAGFYYSEDSLKSKFCLEGNQLMKEFCRQNNLTLVSSKKVVVAQSEEEVQTLKNLYTRGCNAGVELELIDLERLKKIEPYAKSVELALFSPLTASVIPGEICHFLKNKLKERGVKFSFGQKVFSRERELFIDGKKHHYNYLINCAGAYADLLAQGFGLGKKYRLIPFKGNYLSSSQKLPLRTNIYPVPHPDNPFLGVHFTITGQGVVKIGPTATPAWGGENYHFLENIELNDSFESLKFFWKLYRNNNFGFRRLAHEEVAMGIPYFLKRKAGKLVQGIDMDSFNTTVSPGIRAQLFDLEKEQLLNDFVIEQNEKSFHLLNSVSPAFTSSFAFSRYCCQRILE